MSADRKTWFRELEPPPGGAERLRLRLEKAGAPAAMLPARIAIVGACAGVLALAIALFAGLRNDEGADRRAVADVYQAAPFDRLLGRPMKRTDLMVTLNAQPVPVSPVDSSNRKIRIYRID
ncbi:MAG: hypothetical protein ACREVN_04985 [Gammaproteobacteria bacterium]